MPIKSSKIRDARPAIVAEAGSEKDLFTADISRGTVNVKRGSGRSPSFAFKYEELQELRGLLSEIDELLTKNQYSTDESLGDGYEAGTARYTPPSRQVSAPVTAGGDPTTSNEAAQQAGTTPAAEAEVTSDDNPFG